MLNFYFEGKDFFESLLNSIEEAKSQIDLEIYYIADDEIGNEIAEKLIIKAKVGVVVRLIADSVGCLNTQDSFFEKLTQAGIQVKIFNPLLSLNKLSRRRDHRKVAIIDGDRSFLGGMNLAKEYCGDDPKAPAWRDTGIKIQDERLTQDMAHSFDDAWLDRGYLLKDWLRRLKTPDWAEFSHHLVAYYGRYKSNPIRREYIRAIVNAKNHIQISTPYFIPGRRFKKALARAARRGVEVHLLTTGISDWSMVRWASQATYTALLKAGAKIHEYQSRMMHAKSAVIDGEWFTVGTSNLDYISLSYNLEINLFGKNQEEASQLCEQFEKDLKFCRSIAWQDWKRRPFWHKLREKFFYLFKRWL